MKKMLKSIFKMAKFLGLIFIAAYLNVYSTYYMCDNKTLNSEETFYLNATLFGTVLAIYLLLSHKAKGKWLKLALFAGLYLAIIIVSYSTRGWYLGAFAGTGACMR